MTNDKKKGAIVLAGVFTASSVMAMSRSAQDVFASGKSTLKAAQDYTNYLKSTLGRNYLGAKNLPVFNETLQSAKSAVAKLPKGDAKNKLSASVSRSESIIRATESLVKLEDSMGRNAHVIRNVPVFEIYLNKSSNLIGRLSHSEVQDAKDKLSVRNYKMFNEVRDIKVKNTSQYAYALQLYYEGKMFHSIAKDSPTAANVKIADDKISDALNAVWKITTSAIKDKLRDDVKALLREQSKLPGSSIPDGGGSGNGGTGSSSKPQIVLSGNIYMKIKLNEKYKEPGYAAIDEKDGVITNKVKISYMNIVTGETYDALPVDKSATFQIKYTVIDSDKNQGDAYRFIAVGNATLPGDGGNGSGGNGDGDSPGDGGGDSSNDKTPPTIKLIGDGVTFVKFGATFTDKGVSVTDNVDSASNIKITKEYLYNGTKLPSGQTINTSKSGSYTIIYTATDRAGNSSNITRTVIVEELNADTNGALANLSIEKTIPIPIDLQKANLPNGIEIKYIQDTSLVDIEATAASSKATVEIIGDRGTIGSPHLGSVKYVGSISGNSTITIKVTPFMGQDVKTYRIQLKPIAGDNKPAIADAILKAKTKGEVYKLLSGAFGEESGIINPSWADFYIKDNYETGMPGLVITKGILNAVYGEKGNEIVFGTPITTSDYNAIMKYVYAVNSFQIGKMDANAKDRYTQSLVTSAIQKYQENDDSNVKYNQLAHSIGKEYLFDIIDVGSDKEKVYKSLQNYISYDKSCKEGILKDYNGNDIKTGINIGIDFATNLTTQRNCGLNEYLKDEYLEVLNDTAGTTLGAIREKIYANVKGLTVGGKYPRIDLDIVYAANDKAISNAITKLSSFNDESKINQESTPKEILDAVITLRDKTSHRTGKYEDNLGKDREWMFKFDDNLVHNYTYQEQDPVNTSDYYFLDINYKSYAKELAKLKGTIYPYAVREAMEKGNGEAKGLNKIIITEFKNSVKNNKPEETVNALNKMYERMGNTNTKLFNSSSSQVKEEIAEKLIKIIEKKETATNGFIDKLTIKQVIDYINPSSLNKDDEKNLLQKAIDMHKAHINGFNALVSEIIDSKKYEDYKPNPGGNPADNNGQWATARGELISKLDAYIGKISSEYGNTETNPNWISDYQGNASKNKERIAHFILSKNYENEDTYKRKQILDALKNKVTIKDVNEAMKNLITKALESTSSVTDDDMNGPKAP